MNQHVYGSPSKNTGYITRAKVCVLLVRLTLAIFFRMTECSIRKFGSLKTKYGLTVSISIEIRTLCGLSLFQNGNLLLLVILKNPSLCHSMNCLSL